jgi:hypothetical protein
MHPYPTNAPPSTGLLSTTLSLYKNQGLPDHEPEIELFPSYVRTSACARTHTISWRRDREMKGGGGGSADDAYSAGPLGLGSYRRGGAPWPRCGGYVVPPTHGRCMPCTPTARTMLIGGDPGGAHLLRAYLSCFSISTATTRTSSVSIYLSLVLLCYPGIKHITHCLPGRLY